MTVLIAVLLLTMQYRPYEDKPIYFLVILFNVAIVLTLMSGIIFYSNESNVNNQALAILILFLNLCVITVFLLMIISAFSPKLDVFRKFQNFNKSPKPQRHVSETEMNFVQ